MELLLWFGVYLTGYVICFLLTYADFCYVAPSLRRTHLPMSLLISIFSWVSLLACLANIDVPPSRIIPFYRECLGEFNGYSVLSKVWKLFV